MILRLRFKTLKSNQAQQEAKAILIFKKDNVYYAEWAGQKAQLAGFATENGQLFQLTDPGKENFMDRFKITAERAGNYPGAPNPIITCKLSVLGITHFPIRQIRCAKFILLVRRALPKMPIKAPLILTGMADISPFLPPVSQRAGLAP